MTTTWLVDTSAYSRLLDSRDLEKWMERIDRGLVHIAATTRLEVGFGMRDLLSLEAEERSLLGRLVPEYSTPWIEDRAVEVQRELTRRGHHRAPSVPDLLVAATAEAAGHTVLHVDKDFDLITAVTGQPLERLS